MNYDIISVKQCMTLCAAAVIENKEELEEIDKQTGDGDLGISMQKGCNALIEQIAAFGGSDIGMFFMNCALAFNNAAPSTMGTLLSSGFMCVGKEFKGTDKMGAEQVLSIPKLFAKGIMQRGKAKEGDRTILDALIPICRVSEKDSGENVDMKLWLNNCVTAARQGAEKTRNMEPRIGRAKWTPENAKGVYDGGAYLCLKIMESLEKQIKL